jgi:hypothetical protein
MKNPQVMPYVGREVTLAVAGMTDPLVGVLSLPMMDVAEVTKDGRVTAVAIVSIISIVSDTPAPDLPQVVPDGAVAAPEAPEAPEA